MKLLCESLLRLMHEQLDHCRSMEPDFTKQVELCFGIAYSFCRALQILVGYQFNGISEEIEFFKNWKPKFASEMKYYNLLYHSILFEPAQTCAARKFWEREALRLEKFINENQGFLDYYEREMHDFDKIYFRRKDFDNRRVSDTEISDADDKFLTSGDQLLSVFFALQRYCAYATEQLLKFEGD